MSVIPAPLPNASASRRGAMSSADKEKLDLYPADPSSLGGGVDTLAPVGSAPNANGATIAGDTLTLQPADETHPGALTPAAQTIGGAKTFAALLTATMGVVTNLVRAVGASLVLRSSLGASASDVALRLGTEVSDGSTHASAKLVQIGTGIGGTFVEKFYVTKTGAVIPGALTVGGAVSAASLSASGAGAVATGTGGLGVTASSFPLAFSAGWGLVDDGSAEAFRYISTTTFSNLATTLAVWRNSNTHTGNGVMRIRASGRVDQSGTIAGSPGAITINKPTGVVSVASGATSVTVTNSLVGASTRPIATPLADPGSRWWVSRTAGSFTIHLSSPAPTDVPFAWQVSEIL